MTVSTLVIDAFRNAFNIVVEFEKENSKLAAILGTTREGIKEMTVAARQLGATTSYSAAQVTQLQIELAKLGFSKQQILDMEGAVLKFAKAVDTDLSSAAAFAGAALRIFNKDASEAEDVLATFAIATTKTALDFPKLQASLSTVGPVRPVAGGHDGPAWSACKRRLRRQQRRHGHTQYNPEALRRQRRPRARIRWAGEECRRSGGRASETQCRGC